MHRLILPKFLCKGSAYSCRSDTFAPWILYGNAGTDRGILPVDSVTVAVFSAPQQAESSCVQRCSFAIDRRVDGQFVLCFSNHI